MKHTLFFLVVLTMVLMTGCKDKGQNGAPKDMAEGDSVVTDSMVAEENTDTPPMFLFVNDSKYMQLLYWSNIEEPKKTEDMEQDEYETYHEHWALQEMFRRNAALYTNMVVDEKIIKVKFVDEVLKDPDGNRPSIGQIHGREEIPSLSARFLTENPKEKIRDYWGTLAVVTDDYLAARKMLKVNEVESSWDSPKPLAKDIVRKLEQQYGMKVTVSRLCAHIGERYVWGTVQFEGAYDKAPKDEYDPERQFALALDVLVDGDKVYVHESLGHYDERYGATWNADDDGMYIPNTIVAAFEGPKGLELCYTHGAPESYEMGMIYLQEGRLVKQRYEIFQIMIDEEIPVWKNGQEG